MGWTPFFFGRKASQTDYRKWGQHVNAYDEKRLMADPLSLTASIIAVLGVAGVTARAVQKVQEMRHAPLEVVALGNEITDVRLLFTVIENTIAVQDVKDINIESTVGVLALLERARDLLGQIQETHHRIFPPGPTGRQENDKPKISKRLWMREKKNIAVLFKRLRETRHNLQTAISSITCHQTRALPEANLAIQTSIKELEANFAARFDELRAERSKAVGTAYTYHFPSWMVAKAVFFEMSKNDLCGYSASWTLHIPKVLSDSDPVWRFINYGTVPQVMEILSRKQVAACDMNRDGKSLLHFAVEYERPDVCKFLLNQGVSRFFQDDTGFTASMMACEKVLPPTASDGRVVKLEQIQQAFQDDDLSETMDFPPLTLAILRYPWTHALIWTAALRKPMAAQLLIDYGADTSLTDKHCKTALHWAMLSQSREVAEVLIRGRANLEAQDVFGRTALHETAKVPGSVDMITLLLDVGAVLDAKDTLYERTPLYLATYHGRTDNMAALLDRGADMEIVGPMSGHTPLHAAVVYNRLESVRILLDRGANLSVIDKGGKNILHNVAKYGSADVMRAFVAAVRLRGNCNIDMTIATDQ
ncbi:hypothetical protein ACHAQA_009545 [Verticillium albo-atrum]